MRRRMLTLALLGALTTLLTMQLTTAAHAVTPFGPTVTVIQPPCADTPVNADAAAGADGKVHGFVNFSGVTCGRTDIWYFEGAGSSWTAVLSPYRGRVLGVANDLTGTYLLYNDGTNTRIAKRAGTAFTSGRPIAAPAQTGDVIASGGKWWAVFTVTRQAPYIGQVSDVFQAKTIGTPVNYQRITHDDLHLDFDPSLAPRPGGGAVLTWWRVTVEPDGTWPDVSDLMVASSSDGAWAARAFASGAQTGAAYMRPEIASSGRSTFLAWMDAHGTRIGAADNRTGTWVRKVFNTTGYNPRLAASAGRPFVAWQVPSSGTAPTRVFFAEQDAARVWTGTYASPVVATPQLLAAVAAVDGKATVVMMSPTRLYARTQQ